MFGLVGKVFVAIATFLDLSCANSLECVSMNNQECKATPNIIDVNSNEPVFYLLVSK